MWTMALFVGTSAAAMFPAPSRGATSSMGRPNSLDDPAAGNCTENTCADGCVCLPKWKPTWSMARSTILYVDQPNGFHNVSEAIRWGVVVYDWSNAKALWANAQPMNCDELLTKQAEMVQVADPGVPGEQPRVWVYRNTAKALNFYASVREKLDDPAYAGWFVRYDPKRYRGAASNASFVSPPCDWHYNSTYVPKCSGHYHDQTDCPHAKGGGPAYPQGGPPSTCRTMCDCGSNPCGEYTFNFANESFQEWFIHGYMISNATLYHKPHPIGLGWMDDHITMQGMSEEGHRANFTRDTGLLTTQMTELVAAYKATMARFNAAVVAEGGFTWMLMKGKVPRVRPTFSRHIGENVTVNTSACTAILRESCVPHPPAWREATLYLIREPWEVLEQGDQVTAEFLLTRGDYAWVGWGWDGTAQNPRAKEFDVDYGGEAKAPCVESATNPGVFTRQYPKATVTWDCHAGRGSIHMRQAQPETTVASGASTSSVQKDTPALAVGASLEGKFEFAYSYWRDHCDHLPPTHFCGGPNPDPEVHTHTDRMSGGCNIDIADSPSYAFRNRSGTTIILASMNRGSRPMLGPDLLSAKHSCHFYANSSNDPDETKFASHEWIKGVYPFHSNNTAYALNDMEYHQPWNATLPNGTQISGEFKFISITLAISTDGGRWFSHAATPPTHLVATQQIRWKPDTPFFGYRMPSNILQGKRPEHKGFFYAMFNTGVHDPRFLPPIACTEHSQPHCGSLWTPNQPVAWARGVVGGQALGTCIMRTRDLSNPSSWRAWDGGFAVDSETGLREPSFTVDLSTNPYATDAGDAGVAPPPTCAVLANPTNPQNRTSSPNKHNSVLWSTFYKRYMLFGNGGSTNWRFGLSDDLVNWDSWTEVDLGQIMIPHGSMSSPQHKEWCQYNATRGNGISSDPSRCYAGYPYPAVIDPKCKTDNYDEVGQRAYLFTLADAGWSNSNYTTTRDILRIPIVFS